jgi:transcriptional regulatory protein RtcR
LGFLLLQHQGAAAGSADREAVVVSRTAKRQPNDADRLKKYLARFGLAWDDVQM